MSKAFVRVWAPALVAAMAAASGCSDSGKLKTYPVAGTVKYADGSPLTRGTVHFEREKISARGAIQSDGRFVLGTYADADGAHEGSYKISFSGAMEPPASTEGTGGGKDLLDPKFLSTETSGLERTVKAGSNQIDDIVVDKPKAK